MISVNELRDGLRYHKEFNGHGTVVNWDEPGLYITRFRLVSSSGFPFWGVSYCHGTVNGQDVTVALPFSQLPKRGWKHAVVQEAKLDKVYAKQLGIFENVSMTSA